MINVRIPLTTISKAQSTDPISFKAVLSAEEATFDAELQACRALQCPGVILAIGPRAFLLRIGHGGYSTFGVSGSR
jgi:hypothetical protein